MHTFLVVISILVGCGVIAFILDSYLTNIVRVLDGQAYAMNQQAAALDDIADTLDQSLFDTPDGPACDFSRLVAAVEKLAGIEPPAAKADDSAAKE